MPGKNIKFIAGKPLISWTAEILMRTQLVHKKICSTDSQTIADICSQIGLEIPFLRPLDLATDEAPIKDVVRHALDFYANLGENYSHVLLLQATSPTVNSSDIADAIKKGIETDADTVISCYKLENEHPSLMYYSGRSSYGQ